MTTDNRTNELTAERWRKKPVEIEAMRYDGENWVEIAQWLRVHDVRIGQTGTRKASIPTLEGTMYASPGDWIIKGVQGEFYPCKPDIFEQTYERAALEAADRPAGTFTEAQVEAAMFQLFPITVRYDGCDVPNPGAADKREGFKAGIEYMRGLLSVRRTWKGD